MWSRGNPPQAVLTHRLPLGSNAWSSLPRDKAGLRPHACKQSVFSGFHASQMMLLLSGLVSQEVAITPVMMQPPLKWHQGKGVGFHGLIPPRDAISDCSVPKHTPILGGSVHPLAIPGMEPAGSDYRDTLILVPWRL